MENGLKSQENPSPGDGEEDPQPQQKKILNPPQFYISENEVGVTLTLMQVPGRSIIAGYLADLAGLRFIYYKTCRSLALFAFWSLNPFL